MTQDLLNLDLVRPAFDDGGPILVNDVDMVSCVIHGRPFVFAVARGGDHIQNHLRQGRFYESEELDLIKQHFPLGGEFVDIGANVGNHSIFVAAFLAPSKIVPFEPNPAAYKLLIANIAANGFRDVFDLSHLGYGLSDHPADGFAMHARRRNLGSARMVEGAGDISTIVGDVALQDTTPDLIKIDVEGMELQVLQGLRQTIERAKPKIFIEVDDVNDAAFLDWMDKSGYETVQTLRRYDINQNYLIQSRESGGA
ncbi:MAG: FkbM family methyltransferase [Paracoccaceae bacterium]